MAAKSKRRSVISVFLPTLLLAGCLGLGWVIYQQLLSPPAAKPVIGSMQPAQPLPKLSEEAPFVMPPLDDFAAVLERPLFSPTRRPPTETAPSIVVTSDPLDLDLTGVIASGGRRIAIFKPRAAVPAKKTRRRRNDKRTKRTPRTPAAPTSIQLSEGEAYKGWKLEQIEVDAALFVRGEEETWLEINFDAAAPAQPTRRPRSQDSDDDKDREATSEERQWIQGVLEGEGCSSDGDMELDDGRFKVEDVECDDGRTYEIVMDREFKIITKDRE